VRGFGAKEEFIFCLVLIVFMSAVTVFPASAKQGIYISGINPQSAKGGDSVMVYGGGATPGALVTANLTGPTCTSINPEYLNSSSGSILFYDGNYTLLTPNNFSVVYKDIFGNESVEYRQLGNSSLGVIFVGQFGITLGQAFAAEDGSWRIVFVAPQLFPGTYNVSVLDGATLTSDTVSLQLLGSPSVNYPPVYVLPRNSSIGGLNVTVVNESNPFFISSISPSNGPAGTLVTLSGYGASGRIAVSFNGIQVVYSEVSYFGYWSVSFQVPTGLGTIPVMVTDVSSERTAFTEFNVTPVSTPVLSSLFNMLVASSLLAYVVALATVSAAAAFLLIVAAHDRIRRRRRSCL